MLTKDNLKSLFWEGFEGETVIDDSTVVVRLRRTERPRCPDCGSPAHLHQRKLSVVRDLPILDRQTVLQIETPRYRCRECRQVFRPQPQWVHPRARVTLRLARSVGLLSSQASVKTVASWFNLHWETVKNLDKAFLQERLAGEPERPVRLLGMDEFALHKGHRYASVVVDLERKVVLWVGLGRGRAAVEPFFKARSASWLAGIEAVAMDMTAAYELEVNRWCPKAQIVYDLYHVIAKYGREVIDRARVDRANQITTDKKARRVVKGSRWLLLRNRDNLDPAGRVRLAELLQANRPLLKAYLMKEELKALWQLPTELEILKAWKTWFWKATHSGLAPLRSFAHKLKPYLHGIVPRAKWKIGTGIVEGINNRIKVIKRIAYGFRDADYFFLKIRAAFHPLP